MKGIVHVRIDDRMIHGQVAAFWSNYFRATRIMVVNDEVAVNELVKNALRMVAPNGMATSLISVDTAAKNINSGKYDGQRVLLIVKSPVDILRLIEKGVNIREFNVGNMSKRPNTVQIKKSVSITKEEEEAFLKLDSLGVVMTSIMVPDDSKSYIMDYINKKNESE